MERHLTNPMRRLTHRANVPLREEKNGWHRREKSERTFGRVAKGPGVYISSRSMWRGYWYAKSASVKWNRADQVLTGMRWNYYMNSGKATPLFDHHPAQAMPSAAGGLLSGLCGDERAEAFLAKHGVYSEASREAESPGQEQLAHRTHNPTMEISVHSYPLVWNSIYRSKAPEAGQREPYPKGKAPETVMHVTIPDKIQAFAHVKITLGEGMPQASDRLSGPLPSQNFDSAANPGPSAACLSCPEPAGQNARFHAPSFNTPDTKMPPSIEVYEAPTLVPKKIIIELISRADNALRKVLATSIPSQLPSARPEIENRVSAGTGSPQVFCGAKGRQPETGNWKSEDRQVAGIGYIGSPQKRAIQLKVARADALPEQ